MFQKFEVNGAHANVDKKLRAYVTKKIGGLDRYVSRHARKSAHAEVHLKEQKKVKDNNHCRCEVTVYLPHDTLVVKENGLNMYAAVDIAEAKLKTRLQKYKDLHGSGKLQRHLFGRFRRKNAEA
ncbi:MAG TPA: ribosome-associated translation inhibitor RaiA [Candidatus Saccharimonadia bacterium]|nr:ribosome-associated translation inhibitor RaiA [Candidatus Saccharimonadia bacterium]